MAEHTRRDGNELERAPEEAAIDAWVEESSVYLTIPSVRPDVQRRWTPGSPVGATRLRRIGAIPAG